MTPEDKVRLTKAQLQAQQKDFELKNDLLQQQTLENVEMSNRDRLIEREKGDTKAASYWNDVKKEAALFKTPKGQEAYVEWNTSVMQIFAHVCLLSKALIADNSAGRILDFIWNKSISMIDYVGEKTLGASVGTALEQELQKKIYKAKDSQIQPLKYSISFDDTGKLTTEVTKDGQLLSPEQQKLFDVGFIIWAEERGCNFDYTNQVLTDDNGLAMTHEKLKALNQDDENGLNAFFEGKFELKIAQNPAPRP